MSVGIALPGASAPAAFGIPSPQQVTTPFARVTQAIESRAAIPVASLIAPISRGVLLWKTTAPDADRIVPQQATCCEL
jgi:hypothetical protein